MKYQEPASLPMTATLRSRLNAILESGIYTNGPFVAQFEKEYKSTFQLKGECVAVNGCQSGLMLLLTALDVNRCLVPDFTFSATANAAYWSCRSMVTGDCDLKTFNLKPKLPDDVDGVIATHVFGNPCECDRWAELTTREHIPLLYDAAHAHGATFKGKPIGDFGTASVFSLSPTKQVTAAEGGVIVTQDKSLADRLRILRNYGTELHYHQKTPGLNARMSEFHAIIGLESLSRFWPNHRHRLDLVEEYLRFFDSTQTQKVTPNATHAWKDFAVLLGPNRDKVQAALASAGIESKTYFRPVSDLECYRESLHSQKNSSQLYQSILQLPLHINMSLDHVRQVCAIVGGVK